MPMFWSKKSKAEKNYEQAAAPAKGAAAKPSKAAKAAQPAVAKAAKPAKEVAVVAPSGSFGTAADAIIRPRVTEKSGILSQGGVYTFEIAANANKATVAKAVAALYKVTPTRVAIINSPAKNVFVKGRRGVVSGFRKAVVTVKKGDKIDFV